MIGEIKVLLEKTTRMNFLFDFYQALLTEKQRSYMELYYLDDHSLGEIAESYEISRQAVYDNIRRTEAMLEEYEDKLRLLEKFQQRQRVLQELTDAIKDENATIEARLALIEQLKESD
ncbi:MAG: putative DNA-binding protein [Lysinibacillus sp.]